MIEALSTAGTIGGLIAFVVFFLIIPYCLSGDEAGAPAIGWFVVALIATVICFDWVQRLPTIAYVLAIPLYFVIGFLWFIGKWRALILRKKAEADEKIRNRGTSWPGMTDAEVLARLRPDTANHKERIAAWIVLWPWSALWYVAKFPWRLAVKIAEWARGIADRMVDRIWTPETR